MFEVKVIEDSISQDGKRLITLQAKYPRYIHAELMTHRVFSRNASSSRAIPVKTLVQHSLTEMVEPIRWGLNQPGMQANEQDLTGEALEEAKQIWRQMAEVCAVGSLRLSELGLAKQWANRPIEWFGNITIVLSATDWDNWDELRRHADAQPEIHHLADLIYDARQNSTPKVLTSGEWHLPYVTNEERYTLPFDLLCQISAARCCRVSYLKHDGTNPSVEEDLKLCDRLVGARPLHASPFEHVATPDSVEFTTPTGGRIWTQPSLHGNFSGWCQYRKVIEHKFKTEEHNV